MLVGYKVRLRTMVKTDAEAILKIYEEGFKLVMPHLKLKFQTGINGILGTSLNADG